ncbi:hypothetical protein G7Y89_g13532 [Cudoniella acicularis]|uniref:Uncharacterized protein n=1 Tax=Cudoniella acicularis TaxID=354080 RepID=A0A8H4R827_9HELO|nr:hypothetical protein G7Y89_g13532 [Cudoniella acicularis]
MENRSISNIQISDIAPSKAPFSSLTIEIRHLIWAYTFEPQILGVMADWIPSENNRHAASTVVTYVVEVLKPALGYTPNEGSRHLTDGPSEFIQLDENGNYHFLQAQLLFVFAKIIGTSHSLDTNLPSLHESSGYLPLLSGLDAWDLRKPGLIFAMTKFCLLIAEKIPLLVTQPLAPK